MNVNKLKGKIVENGMSIKEVSESIGLDKSTFYRKLNNQGETFTVREINLLRNALKLTKEEAMAIFFMNSVALGATS